MSSPAAAPLRFILAALLVFSSAAPASAEPLSPLGPGKNKVAVELTADVTAIAPGETFELGLFLRPQPGWHVYWKHSGDTGLPTAIHWTTPDGYDLDEVTWPLPTRFPDKLGGRSFGYADEVLHTTTVRVPDDALEGSTVTFEAKVRWLACKENCIQESAHVALPLRVLTTARDTRESPSAPAFARWAARVPTSDSPLTVTSAVLGEPVPPNAPFQVDLTVSDPAGAKLTLAGDPRDAFFPATADLDTPEIQAESLPDGRLLLHLRGRSSTTSSPATRLTGVVQLQRDGQPHAFEVAVPVARAAAPLATAALQQPALNPSPLITSPRQAISGDVCEGVDDLAASTGADDGKLSSFALALLFAFLGGLILNAMPCVLPVLSLKIMGLVEQSGQSPRVIWRHGLVYTAGVLASFLVFAILLIALQQGSWAFQFQDPTFVAIFTAIVFAFGLSLFGVFEIALPGTGRLDAAVHGSHGYLSSFNYGIFAVLLGTPCTAPFLGPALAFAFTQPPLQMTLLLLTVGLGLAFPFLVLARFPGWRKIMPRPGAWLITFKKVMGFLLIGTAVFMLSIFAAQVSRAALISYLVFLAVLSFALFVYGHWASPMRSQRVRLASSVIALGLVVGGALRLVSVEPAEARAAPEVAGGLTWLDFDRTDVNQTAQDGHLVFVDFTADWCTTCKVNEATALHTDATQALFQELSVTAVKGDFTVHKPEIAKWLTRFEEPSVPLYVVVPAGKPEAAFKLPTLLSESDVRQGLCRAHRIATQATL